MRKIIARFKNFWSLESYRCRVIAQSCGDALKDLGLHVPGSVFQVRNSQSELGWLVNLAVPPGFSLSQTEMLALRMHLTSRFAHALGTAPQRLHVIVSLNIDFKRMPPSQAVINEQWLRGRIQTQLSRVAPTAQLRLLAPDAPSTGPTGAKTYQGNLWKKAAQAALELTQRHKISQRQGARPLPDGLAPEAGPSILSVSDSDFDVGEGSLSEFQRAYR